MHTSPGHRRPPARLPWVALVPALLLGMTGCTDHTARIRELERDNARLRGDLRRQQDDLIAHQATIDSLRATVGGLQQTFVDRDIAKLYHVSDVQIGRLSGGWDADDAIGDEGVTVYLKLIDTDGQPYKAAGAIDLTVLDLDRDPAVTLATCAYDVDDAREVWYGQLMSYHYKIRCAWGDTRPSGRTVVVRVTFTDYLTGQPFTAVRTLDITPPMVHADRGE